MLAAATNHSVNDLTSYLCYAALAAEEAHHPNCQRNAILGAKQSQELESLDLTLFSRAVVFAGRSIGQNGIRQL